MKTIATVVAAVFLSVSATWAADVITFPSSSGDVPFSHKKHQQLVKNCKACHEGKVGKIPGFNKEKAHKLCWDCHKTKSNGKGPVPPNCSGCHKKK